MERGFFARELLGQSRRTEELFPLNQIEIKYGTFPPEVEKVTMAPTTTQIYISYGSEIALENVEQTLVTLEKSEQILNEITVFSSGETKRFDAKTEMPVKSISLSETKYELHEKLDETFTKLQEIAFNEMSMALLHFASGDITTARMILNSCLEDFTLICNDLIQRVNWQDPRSFEEQKKDFDRQEKIFRKFKEELASAKSTSEKNDVMKRFSAFIHSDIFKPISKEK